MKISTVSKSKPFIRYLSINPSQISQMHLRPRAIDINEQALHVLEPPVQFNQP